MNEEFQLIFQVLGPGGIGVIALWMYHKFTKDLQAQYAAQHEAQHQAQGERHKQSEIFLKDMFALVIRQQQELEALYQRNCNTEEDKQMFFRLALQAFEKMGANAYADHLARQHRPREDAEDRSHTED